MPFTGGKPSKEEDTDVLEAELGMCLVEARNSEEPGMVRELGSAQQVLDSRMNYPSMQCRPFGLVHRVPK